MTKWWRHISWFKAIGSTIIFVAWIAQNFYLENKHDELAYLDRAQMLISIEEGHFSEWLSHLMVEQQKEKPNPNIVQACSLKAAQHQLNILAWATARITDPATHDDLIREKRELEGKLATAYTDGKIEEIVRWLSGLINTADVLGHQLIKAANERYVQAREAKSFWGKFFLISYSIGTLILGFGIVRQWLKEGKRQDAEHITKKSSGRGLNAV